MAQMDSGHSRISLEITGLTPLLCANPEADSECRLPEAQFLASLYRISNDRWGYPADAIYSALKTAYEPQGELRNLLTIESGRLLEITGAAPQMRSFWSNGRDGCLIFRAEFDYWRIQKILVRHSKELTDQDVVLLFDKAGFTVGIGKRRPEKGGHFGAFLVTSYTVGNTTVRRNSFSDDPNFTQGVGAWPEDAENTTSTVRMKL